MTDERFIKHFDILIGSWMKGTTPFIQFQLNGRITTCELKEFKKLIDIIYESKGDRNKKSYEAFIRFRSIFADLLFPFMNFDNIKKDETTND